MANDSNVTTTPTNASEFIFTAPQHSRSTFVGLVIMAVVILVENLTVCALFAANKKLRITTNVFVISLAVSDLCVAVLFIPVYLATPIGHEANLYVVTFLLFTSLFNLCGVTYDRYHAILQPLTYHSVFTSLRIAYLLFAIWFVPLVLILLPVSWSRQNFQTIVMINRIYLGFMVLLVFLAYVVISKVYFSICKAIRGQLRMASHVKVMFDPTDQSSTTSIERSSVLTPLSSIQAESVSLTPIPTPEEERRGQESNLTPFATKTHTPSLRKLRKIRFKNYSEKVYSDVRAVKLFAVVILIFIICWLPAIITNFMIAIDKAASIPHFIFDVSVYAFVANAMVNPLLFTFYKADYREALLQIFVCRCKYSKTVCV